MLQEVKLILKNLLRCYDFILIRSILFIRSHVVFINFRLKLQLFVSIRIHVSTIELLTSEHPLIKPSSALGV
ncbi:hypothetical protein YC2023_102206 [Brassica napus]